MRGTVVVFARAPGRGDAKTRLAPTLGPELTARLYRAMLTDTLRNARLAGARVALAHTPSTPFPEQSLADLLIEQRGTTFGERFDHALADAYAATGGPLALIGADTPHLSPEALRRAFETLERKDAVIGPGPEGGFYLIGFRQQPTSVRDAFDASNETAALAARLRPRGSVALLEPTFDLDLPSDLVELMLHAELHAAMGTRACAEATLTALAVAGIRVEPTRSGERARRVAVPGARTTP